MKVLIENIIRQLQEIQEGKIWIGTNFHKKFNLISEAAAFKVVHKGTHTIAEIIAHLTIWRNETCLKMKTAKGSITDENGADWADNSLLKQIGWDKIKDDYENSLTELIALLQTKNDDFLNEMYYDTDYKDHFEYQFLINGMLHHDLYHLGQLGLLIKILKP